MNGVTYLYGGCGHDGRGRRLDPSLLRTGAREVDGACPSCNARWQAARAQAVDMLERPDMFTAESAHCSAPGCERVESIRISGASYCFVHQPQVA